MIFYKIKAQISVADEINRDMSREDQFEVALEVREKSEAFLNKTHGESLIFLSCVRHGRATFGALVKNGCDINKLFNKYKPTLPIKLKHFIAEEITFTAFVKLLVRSSNNSYIDDVDKTLEFFEIGDINPCHHSLSYSEELVNDNLPKDKIYDMCSKLLLGETMVEELDRIYVPNKVTVKGHPVHYILQLDKRESRKTVCQALLSALYSNNRIKNKRYCIVDFDEHSNSPSSEYEALYKSCDGGTIIVQYMSEECDEVDSAGRCKAIIDKLCEIATKYKNKVLTVICLPRAAEQRKQQFLSCCGDTSFVKIYEDVIYGEQAAAYLKNRAKEYKVRPDKKLTEFLNDDKSGYNTQDLNDIFDKWYDQKLRNVFYPQYKNTAAAQTAIKNQKPKGSAYDKLQQMIGLESAKRVMDKALNYFKAQKLFADRGIIAERPAMHMIFTGNPGTAKTTVARLFAKIMKENGLLPIGDIHEVGRSDLVGKYVGWTAKCVKDAFKKAKGGVLFIDEAYSLVDDRSGSFGDEAINTIVQEMENHRQDTIVIFAGYPKEMEGFLNKNPGLSSRIAFHIPFDDYNAKELCEISEFIAKEKGLKLEKSAVNKLRQLFDLAKQKSDFGNGRYVRNVIEKATMAQADRLMQMQLEQITEKDMCTICEGDIELPKNEEKTIKIGFLA